MLNDNIKRAIKAVNSVKDFDNLLYTFQMSDANQALKDEAIRELKAVKSAFFINPLYTPKKEYEDIKAAEADMSDIN